MLAVSVLICLTILTSQHVHSKLITINITDGSDSNKCCVKGECPCSSLSTALHSMTSNTVINITSESVILHGKVTMGSGHLTNITVTGNDATIMCNNSGRVECDWCSNVVIDGITWDKCGHIINIINQTQYPPGPAGVMFSSVSNISIINCTFQHCQVIAIALCGACEKVVVDGCNFLSNKRKAIVQYNNVGGLYVSNQYNLSINLLIHGSTFYDNGQFAEEYDIDSTGLRIDTVNNAKDWNITISNTSFSYNSLASSIVALGYYDVMLTITEVFVYNNQYQFREANNLFSMDLTSTKGDLILSILYSLFSSNKGRAFVSSLSTDQDVTVVIYKSIFADNQDHEGIVLVYIYPQPLGCRLTFTDVHIANNSVSGKYTSQTSILSLSSECYSVSMTMYQLNVVSNTYHYETGGAVYIKTNPVGIIFQNCTFFNNTSVRGPAAVYIDENVQYRRPMGNYYSVDFKSCTFDYNTADDSIFYIDVPTNINIIRNDITITASNFTNNKGVCLYLTKCNNIFIEGSVLFKNNSAYNGAAMYLDEKPVILIRDGAVLEFIDNSAFSIGDAIFVELFGCPNYPVVFLTLPNTSLVSIISTLPGYSGIAVYFSVSKFCVIDSSLVKIPYQFNYSRVINGELVSIPCNHYYNYSNMTITHFPVATSPQKVKLYHNDINFIELADNVYRIINQVLLRPVAINAIVLDYFDKPAETTEFFLSCIDCYNVYTLISSQLELDNTSPLHVTLVGEEVMSATNITLHLLSHIQNYYKSIEVTLVIELVPCPDHPGYFYSTTTKGCICYHHDVVECYDDYNEIKRGYWFGSVSGKATTSLCPGQYCMFVNRKETRDSFFKLPNRVNDQCNHHRSGPACGECSPGYTLAYDSTDCISEDHCSVGMTVLVVVLTCFYWITLVSGVFCLMYFNFQLSSGYLYGIIYYYSMVGILLSNNPYISSSAFQFINILSGFAQLTPQFLGQLCLVNGLSGIDQLFIQYCHSSVVAVLLFAIVLTAKYSRKVSEFIGRCIIRVFCLLLLLAYTLLVSTSLQLLRPLTFTDLDGIYTYSTPTIKYFRERHVLYGTVALLCELIIGIGLPLLLLLEPFLRRKINFVRIKPILDQFQGCYKDRFSWFASYYLICRQVIMCIVLLGNSNYDSMLLYLILTCIVIATAHMWLQPYKNLFLNIFDGMLLQLMLLAVIIGSFDFLQSSTTALALILVTFPLIVLFFVAIIKKVLHYKRHQYFAINEGSNDEDLLR